MTTRLQLSTRISRVLGDTKFVTYPADLLVDSIERSMDAILPWISKSSIFEIVGDGTTLEFELPEDLYRIVGVYDVASDVWLPRAMISPDRKVNTSLTQQDWLEFPAGSIGFGYAPTSETIYQVYYGSIWPKPTTDTDSISTPLWTHTALVYYACSYATIKEAVNAANVRQWNVKVDSGDPTMNPMKDMSNYFHERFRIEMDSNPTTMRGSK